MDVADGRAERRNAPEMLDTNVPGPAPRYVQTTADANVENGASIIAGQARGTPG